MTTTDREMASDRVSEALAALEPFVQRLLPGMVRRALAWRGLGDLEPHELLLDLQQELRVDCLQQPDWLLGLPVRDRHQHWFRLADRWIYRQRLGSGTPLGDLDPPTLPGLDEIEASADNLRQLLPDAPQRVLEQLARGTRRHGNGRCHVGKTATQMGISKREMRKLWERVAEQLGYGDEFVAFWRRRLAEAITGLAADLLRDTDQVHLLRRPRSRPDPRGRIRRIQRIHETLRTRPLDPTLRKAMTNVLRDATEAGQTPVALLALAEELAPDCATVALWQFEAHGAGGAWPQAVRALRRARWQGASPVATTLARARLLEAHGRTDRARRCLRQRTTGRGAHHRLRLALRQVSADPRYADPRPERRAITRPTPQLPRRAHLPATRPVRPPTARPVEVASTRAVDQTNPGRGNALRRPPPGHPARETTLPAAGPRSRCWTSVPNRSADERPTHP